MPELVASDFGHFVSLHSEEVSERILVFVGMHAEFDRWIGCLHLYYF